MTMGPNYGRSIAQSLAEQETKLLTKGKLSDWRFSQIRQRHIWSVFHFNCVNAGSPIQIVAGIPTIQAGVYNAFVTLQDANGQGLPSGLTMTASDTNNLGSGRVPDDQNFAVWELGASIYRPRPDIVALAPTLMSYGNPHPDDVDRILCEGVLSVKYLTNDVPIGHLLDFAQSGGPAFDVPSLLSYTDAAGPDGATTSIAGGLSEGSFTAQPWSQRVGRLAANSGNGNPNPGTRRKFEVPIFLAATQTYNFNITFARNVQLRAVKNGGTAAFSLRLDTWAVESFRDAG